MNVRRRWPLAFLGLAALAAGASGALAAEDEKPEEKGKEAPAGPRFKVQAHRGGAHVVGIRQKDDAAVGDCFEVLRGARLVAFAQAAEIADGWPKLAYLVGSGRPGDDLVPLSDRVPFVQLLTDDREAIETKELKALLGDRLVIEELAEKITLHGHCDARIVIIHGGVFFMMGDQIAGPFAREGKTVIVDTLAYSHIKGEVADETKFKEATTLRILREEGLTAGFPPESRIPWFGTRGKQFLARYFGGLPEEGGSAKLIATDHSAKNSAILDIDAGGRMLVLDLITPSGAAGRDAGAKNKLIFVARALGSGPRHARYMPSRPEYDDLIGWFDALAEKHGGRFAKSFEGGGEKKEDFVYSYTAGAKDKPLVVLAACQKGTAWLGATAVLRLAEVLLENAERDPKIDWLLARLRIKLLPALNPHGCRANTDLTEAGVELDRNFGYHWEEFDDLKVRGREPFSEPGAQVVRRSIEAEKPAAFLEVSVDGYDAGYRIVRARDGSDAQRHLLQMLVTLLNARLRYRYVVGDQPLRLRLTRDAQRPSAINWVGSKGVLAASLRICGDGEDSITSNDVAIEAALHFLQLIALSHEEPEPPPAPKGPAKAPSKAQAK